MKKQASIDCARERVDVMRLQMKRLEAMLLAEESKLGALKEELAVAERACQAAWSELFEA